MITVESTGTSSEKKEQCVNMKSLKDYCVAKKGGDMKNVYSKAF